MRRNAHKRRHTSISDSIDKLRKPGRKKSLLEDKQPRAQLPAKLGVGSDQGVGVGSSSGGEYLTTDGLFSFVFYA